MRDKYKKHLCCMSCLSTLKRRLKVMNIGPDIVMEAVAVTISKVSCLTLQVDCVVQNFQ